MSKKKAVNVRGDLTKGELDDVLGGKKRKLASLDKILVSVLGSDVARSPRVRKIIEKLVEKAEGGDIRAMELLFDRAYGKVKHDVDIKSGGDKLGVIMVESVNIQNNFGAKVSDIDD